jgi:hypothetical protein
MLWGEDSDYDKECLKKMQSFATSLITEFKNCGWEYDNKYADYGHHFFTKNGHKVEYCDNVDKVGKADITSDLFTGTFIPDYIDEVNGGGINDGDYILLDFNWNYPGPSTLVSFIDDLVKGADDLYESMYRDKAGKYGIQSYADMLYGQEPDSEYARLFSSYMKNHDTIRDDLENIKKEFNGNFNSPEYRKALQDIQDRDTANSEVLYKAERIPEKDRGQMYQEYLKIRKANNDEFARQRGYDLYDTYAKHMFDADSSNRLTGDLLESDDSDNLYDASKNKSNSNKIDFKNSGNIKLINYCKKGINSICKEFNATVTYEDTESFHAGYGYQDVLNINIKIGDKSINYSLLLPTWRRLNFGHGVNKVHFNTDLRRNNKEIKGFNQYAFDSDKDVIDFLFSLIRDDLSKGV